MKKKIIKEMMITEVLEKNDKAGEILFMMGLGCVGCSMAGNETIEQGCMAHGMDEIDIDLLIKKLNETD
ncbi:DUF1858 domain-containing protein [archaeon]|jgi:hybrid cluster-associated redox disulfide protein|nr:DUF1858 domain-containing protein [archaeon]